MMKNKNLLIGLCSVPLLLSISTSMTAQDLRERTYYYERPLHLQTGKVSTSVGDYWNKMELTLPSTSTVLQTARHSVYQKIQLKTPVTLLTKLPLPEKQPIGSVH